MTFISLLPPSSLLPSYIIFFHHLWYEIVHILLPWSLLVTDSLHSLGCLYIIILHLCWKIEHIYFLEAFNHSLQSLEGFTPFQCHTHSPAVPLYWRSTRWKCSAWCGRSCPWGILGRHTAIWTLVLCQALLLSDPKCLVLTLAAPAGTPGHIDNERQPDTLTVRCDIWVHL